MTKAWHCGPLLIAAVASTVAFAAYTIWWLADGGAMLDAETLRFADWLQSGALDPIVSDSWPLGEPQVAVAIVLLIAVLLATRRRYGTAALIVSGFVALTLVQLAIVVVAARVRKLPLDLNVMTHLYPSGHAARVPYLGVSVAAIASQRLRGWVLAGTVLLAIMVAVERTNIRKQGGSVVIGGLLLGTTAALWLVACHSRRDGILSP